jgi:hypothetical protein
MPGRSVVAAGVVKARSITSRRVSSVVRVVCSAREPIAVLLRTGVEVECCVTDRGIVRTSGVTVKCSPPEPGVVAAGRVTT